FRGISSRNRRRRGRSRCGRRDATETSVLYVSKLQNDRSPHNVTAPLPQRRSPPVAVLILALFAATTASCAGDFDTTRVTPPRGSLGRELYSMVCGRVGAQALRQDVTGGSYHAICHPHPATGKYDDQVDQALLGHLDPTAV